MDLVKHFEQCFEQANSLQSKLQGDILDIKGWSSYKQKHLLNNLCSWPDARYLEIGVWKGATHIAALYGNDIYSVAIDDFSKHWDDMGFPDATMTVEQEANDFKNNCIHFLNKEVTLINADYITAKKKLKRNDFNIYFYDGDHSELSQEQAITEFYPYLCDEFIYLVDDYNWDHVRIGTENGIAKLNMEILGKWELIANKVGDEEEWWNGMLVLVCRKKKAIRKKKG